MPRVVLPEKLSIHVLRLAGVRVRDDRGSSGLERTDVMGADVRRDGLGRVRPRGDSVRRREGEELRRTSPACASLVYVAVISLQHGRRSTRHVRGRHRTRDVPLRARGGVPRGANSRDVRRTRIRDDVLRGLLESQQHVRKRASTTGANPAKPSGA